MAIKNYSFGIKILWIYKNIKKVNVILVYCVPESEQF